MGNTVQKLRQRVERQQVEQSDSDEEEPVEILSMEILPIAARAPESPADAEIRAGIVEKLMTRWEIDWYSGGNQKKYSWTQHKSLRIIAKNPGGQP